MSANDFVQHGQELVDSGQYQQAVKVCRLGLLAHPTAIAGRLVLGTALMLLRRYDEVLAEMRVALEIDSTNPRAMALKGEALMHKGDPAQAAQILYQARAYAPEDPRLMRLCQEAEVLMATSDPGDFTPSAGDMTKHYPAMHQGGGRDRDEDSDVDGAAHITMPRSGGMSAYRDGLSGFDDDLETRAGDQPRQTMDLDPMDDSAVEILSNHLPEAAERDSGDSSEMTGALDTYKAGGPLGGPLSGSPAAQAWDPDFDDELDLAAATSTMQARGKRELHAPRASNEETAHYRKLPDSEPSRPARRPPPPARPEPMRPPPPARPEPMRPPPPRYEDDARQASRRAPELPLIAPRTEIPKPPAQVMQQLDALFPENDAGVSRMLLMPEHRPESRPEPPRVPAGPVENAIKQVRAPNQPTLAIPPARLDGNPGDMALGPDMQRLRQDAHKAPPAAAEDSGGLLMSMVEIDGQLQSMLAPREVAPMAAPPPVPSPPPAAPFPAPAPPAVPAVPMNAAAPRKRSLLTYLIYALVGLGVVAGGVVAGFKIREIRLERQIRNTQRDALSYLREDTFAGYSRARAAYARIVSVRSDEVSLSALARTQAALAAEFGEGLEEAEAQVAALGDADNLDAAIARAYLAHATGDLAGARALAEDIEKRYPDEFMGPYLSGLAALGAGDADTAVRAFDRAGADDRPIVKVGLGRAHLANGSFNEAGDAFKAVLTRLPDHPEALMGRAWVAIARNLPPDDIDAQVTDLESLIGAGEDNALASRRQRARAVLALSALERLRGQTDAARTALQSVRDLMPMEDARFSVDLMRALISVRDREAAAKEAERALDKWPKDVDVRVAAAEVAVFRDKPREAVDILSGDISNNARALSTRGRAFLALGELEPAVRDLDASIELLPSAPDVVIARAAADRRNGNPDMAAKRLQPLYTEDGLPEVAIAYAAALRESRQRADARAILERLVEQPSAGRALLELARLERDDAHFAKAREAYEKAVAALPEESQVKLEAVLLRLDTGDIKTARESLEKLLEEQPDNPRILLESARVFTMTGAYQRAARALDAAEKLATAPRWQVARERGRLALRQGKVRDAVKQFTAAPDVDDKDGEIWLLLMDAQLAEDDIEGALETKETVYKKYPLSAPVRDMARARLALYDDRLKDALDAYDSARRKLKKDRAPPRALAEVYFWTGRAYFYADKLDQARDAMATAIDNNPGLADGHFWLGFASLELERNKAAETALREAVALDPAGIPEAWFYLGEALRKQKRSDDARQAFQEYVTRFPEGNLVQDARDYIRQLGTASRR